MVPTCSPLTALSMRSGLQPFTTWNFETRREVFKRSSRTSSNGRVFRFRFFSSPAPIASMKEAEGSVLGSASKRPSTSFTRVIDLQPKHSPRIKQPASVRWGGILPTDGGCSQSEYGGTPVKILGASHEAFEFPDLKIEGTKQASGN